MDWAKYNSLLDGMAERIKDGSAVKALAEKEKWINDRLKMANEARDLKKSIAADRQEIQRLRDEHEQAKLALSARKTSLDERVNTFRDEVQQKNATLSAREQGLNQRDRDLTARETKLERREAALKADQDRASTALKQLQAFKEAV
ncbi:MAG: hypothetical protein ACR2RE_03410 [Geminicoccaceae bacterium]